METDESTVSHCREIVLKEPTFMITVLIYCLGWSKMESWSLKLSLFRECLLKMMTLVLYGGVPEEQKRCQVTLKPTYPLKCLHNEC